MSNSINISLITFTCDYQVIGSLGTTKYYKLRDQVLADGPMKVLFDSEDGKKVIDMFKVADDTEFWLIPYFIVVSGDKVIPAEEKNMLDWYKSKFWSDYTGDVRGLVLALEGIDIHGQVEHNGITIWNNIQAVSPTRRRVKFNAAEEVRLSECEYEGESVFYVTK
jgi:hypothetical protein